MSKHNNWTREASHLALLRWLLPSQESVGATANQQYLSAQSPGQNRAEAYGMAAFIFIFHSVFFAVHFGIWVAIPAALIWLHLVAVGVAFLTAVLRKRGFLRGQGSQNLPHRLGFGVITLVALASLGNGSRLLTILGALWLGFVLLNLAAWFIIEEQKHLGLVFFGHLGAALIWTQLGWPSGLAVFFVLHMVVLWGLLRAGSTLFCPVTRHFKTTRREVFLTIDDGPTEDTTHFLEILARHQAKAMFFVIGEIAAAHPERVRAIHAAGQALGNHTQTHPQGTFWCLPPGRIRTQIDGPQEALTQMTGERPRWFRAPVGFSNLFLNKALEERELRYLGWTARGFDGVHTSAEKALSRLKKSVRPGSIILLHQGRSFSPDLLEALLRWLDSEGFHCVLPNLFENE